MIDTYQARDVDRIARALSEPLDPEREMYRAARHRYVAGYGDVARVRCDPHHMSFLTGTNVETIYASSVAGTAKATFTTEFQINDRTAMGTEPILPPFFFLPGPSSVGKAVRITARGITGTTSAAPTWQHFVRFNSGTPAVPPTGPNVGSTPLSSAMAVVSKTNLMWEYESDVTLVSMGTTPAATTLRGTGIFTAQTDNTANAELSKSFPIFGGNASPGTVATFDISGTTFITYSVTCGTSNAANSVQLLQLLIFGLN